MATHLPSTYVVDAQDSFTDPEEAVQGRLKFAMIAVAVLIFGIFGAAALVPIGGAVIGTGQVSVESKVKRIAHPTGGVIAEIRVRDGDRVKRGDILLRLDTTVSGVSSELSAEGVDQLMAQRARLEAEREERGAISFPRELTSRNDASARAAMASESRLFQLRRAEQAGQVAQLNERMRQLDQQINGYDRQIAALNQQSEIIEPERDGLRQLYEKRLVNISRLNQLERTAVDLRGSAAAIDSRIAEARARISEIREQIINVRQAARTEAGAELARVTAALSQQKVQSVSTGDAFERSVIRAPYDGVVDKLAFNTIGGVVPPAQTILEIVPDQDELTVSASISPADIDQVRAGQSARVRFSAFSAQTTPEFPGKVTFVSAEVTTDERSGMSFYRINVDVEPGALSREQALELVPGMPAEVFVETGSRSMLSYITKPLRDQFSRAFRDG